jgi:acetylglutamate kinase
MLAIRVVKIGGNELDRPEWVAKCARAIKAAGSSPTVVVHGGGQAVSAWSRRLGLPVEQRDGLRVTTPEIAELVEMVLGGPMNRLLVEALRAAGLDAIGLCGVDGGLLTAQPLPGDLGEVGEIVDVRASLLQSLLLAGLTPVVAPVAPCGTEPGRPLNVNADQAAAAIAGAIGAHELLFLSDVPGVAVEGVAQPTLAAAEIETLIELGIASGGMAAKLRAAAQAVGAGVRAVRIGGIDMFESATAGTRLLAAAPVIQPA